MVDQTVEWLRGLAKKGGKGVVNNIDARCLSRIADNIEQLREALRLTEFGFNHSRCPVCAGFNVGPNGETDKVHTANCPVGKAMAANQ